jgi:hypothetical protein
MPWIGKVVVRVSVTEIQEKKFSISSRRATPKNVIVTGEQ